jgi:hypothetical protein
MHKNFSHILVCCLLLGSCASIVPKNIAPGYVEAFGTIKDYFLGSQNTLLTPSLIESIPYASSILRIGKGAPGLIILESYSAGKASWVSADGVLLVIEQGRVVSTRGLPNNSYYSYDSPVLIDLELEVTLIKKSKEIIQLTNKALELTLYEEIIKNKYLGWLVVNKYWADENYFVWKSEQSISPRLPKFFIEVTKKPAK